MIARGLKYITLDMDSSVSPTHGDQEGSAWNGHFDCTCYHPLFVFNQFGMLERCALRHGNVHSADGWQEVLDPVIARYADRDLVRASSGPMQAMPIPRSMRGWKKRAISTPSGCLPTRVLREKIAHRLTRPVGRPSLTKVKRFYEDFEYQAASWDKPRRVIAKIEWHPGELFPRVGFIVTNLPMRAGLGGTVLQSARHRRAAYQGRQVRLPLDPAVVQAVPRQRGTAATARAGLQPRTFLRCIDLPEAMADWSLTSLQLKLIKIGARVVRHARAITFQLAEVAVTGTMVRAILAAIRRLRAPPLCA